MVWSLGVGDFGFGARGVGLNLRGLGLKVFLSQCCARPYSCCRSLNETTIGETTLAQ